MKTFFFKDSVLKVISFVVAVLIWFYIIIVADPSVDISIKDIPIKYVNQANLEERGLAIINDDNVKVELKIRGSRKKIANIDNNNVYATVDLANIAKTGTFLLPVSISIPYEYDEIVSKKPYNVDVIVDRVIEEEREVEIIPVGNTANGYIAGKPSVSTSKVVLTGPSTLLNKIEAVAAYLSFDERSAEIKDNEKLCFVDSNGKRIDENNKIYNMVSISTNSVEVSCPIFKLKNVPIVIDTEKLPNAENYKMSVQPSNVSIYAENEILETVSELSTEKVDFKALANDGMIKVKLAIPEGVSLRDGISEITIKAELK